MVNCNDKITSYFDITYLKETEISYNNHKLSYSTSLKNDPNVIKKNLEEQSRNITTSQKEILNFDIGLLMTRKTCEKLLSKLDDVEKIRYIILTSKLDVKSNKEQLPNYSYSPLKNYNMEIGLKSMLIKPYIAEELVQIGNVILKSVIHNIPDSFLGLSIIADAPECNNAMLNIKRPGVLRQYYGMDIEKIDDTVIKRVAYRSQTSFTSEGSDPLKLVVKPFPNDMIYV